MGYLLGESVQLGVGQEAVRGTGVTPTAWLPARTPSGIRVVVDKVLVQETRASRITSQGSEITQKRVEGDVEFNIKNNSIVHFLKSLLGTVTSGLAGGESAVWEHVVTVELNDPQNPSLTLALAKPSFQDYRYDLVVPSSLEIATPVDDLVTGTMEFVGKDESTVADYTPSFDADDYYFRNHDVTIKLASDVAGLAGAQALKVKEFSLSIANNARVNQNISDYNPSDVLGMLIEITGSMKIDYEDETHHDTYVAGTYQAMQISMVRTDVTIGVASNPEITVVLPKVSFESLEQDRPIDDILADGIEFTAHYDTTEAKAIEITVVNEVEDYDAVIGS